MGSRERQGTGLGGRLLRGSFWSLVTIVVTKGTAVGCAVLYARVLGRTGYGELGIIQSSALLFTTFAGLGLGMTATRYVANLRGREPVRAGRIAGLVLVVALVSSAVFAAAMAAASPALARSVYRSPRLGGLLACVSVAAFLGTLFGACSGVLAGFQAFRAMARVAFWSGLVSVPITAVLVLFWGLAGAVGALIAVSGVSLLLSARACAVVCRKAAVPLALRGAWGERAVLWGFSLPAYLGGVLVAPVTWAASAVLVRQENGFAQLGLFTAASTFRSFVYLLPGAIGRVALPLMSEAHGTSRAELAKVVSMNSRAAWAAALPVSVLVMASARPALGWLFGREYAEAWIICEIMVGLALLEAFFTPLAYSVVGMGRMWRKLALNAAWGLALLVLAASLVPAYRGTGLAASHCLSYAVNCALVLLTVWALVGRDALAGLGRGAALSAGLMMASVAAAALLGGAAAVACGVCLCACTGAVLWRSALNPGGPWAAPGRVPAEANAAAPARREEEES